MKREGHPSVRQRLLANETIRRKIAFRAYQIFEERGRLHGYDKEDWQQAETEILSEWMAREESALQLEEGYPGSVTGVSVARPERKKETTRERQALSADKATATNKGGEKSSRAKTKVKVNPAQKPSPPDIRSNAEQKLEPRKKDNAGPKNRKKKSATEASSSL